MVAGGGWGLEWNGLAAVVVAVVVAMPCFLAGQAVHPGLCHWTSFPIPQVTMIISPRILRVLLRHQRTYYTRAFGCHNHTNVGQGRLKRRGNV